MQYAGFPLSFELAAVKPDLREWTRPGDLYA